MVSLLVFLSFLGVCVGNNKQNSVPDDLTALSDRELILELLHRVNELEERDLIQQVRIEQQEVELEEHRTEINQLKQRLKQTTFLNQLGKEKFHQSKEDVADGEKEKETTSSDINRRPINSRRQKRQGFVEKPVAFFATLTGHILNMGAHQNIVFDNVVTNKGDAYNPHHGIFVAPVTGTYVFTPTILAYNNAEVWCDLVVNNVAVARTYARGTDNRHDQGSITAVVSLTAGDDVAVQSTQNGDSIYGEPVSYTAFSGFLLAQE